MIVASPTSTLFPYTTLFRSGPNFCAGADLNWMSWMVSYTRDENVRDSSQLARMYALMNECRLPVIRSGEHTSELQSRPHLVRRILLEKKDAISIGTASSVCL